MAHENRMPGTDGHHARWGKLSRIRTRLIATATRGSFPDRKPVRIPCPYFATNVLLTICENRSSKWGSHRSYPLNFEVGMVVEFFEPIMQSAGLVAMTLLILLSSNYQAKSTIEHICVRRLSINK